MFYALRHKHNSNCYARVYYCTDGTFQVAVAHVKQASVFRTTEEAAKVAGSTRTPFDVVKF